MDLINLNGIGSKKVEILNSLNIFTTNDLFTYYPYSVQYIEYTDLSNDDILVKGSVFEISKVSYIKRNFSYFTFKVIYDNQILVFKVFNQAYLHSKLIIGKEVSVMAKLSKNVYAVTRIIFDNQVPFFIIKYRSNSKIKSAQISTIINSALVQCIDLLKCSVPNELFEKYKLLPYQEAIYLIHNPKNMNDYNMALRTLKYCEAFEFMTYIKNNHVDNISYEFNNIDLSNNLAFINDLSFDLTSGQLKVIREIYSDIANNKRINRLLHGDVGCGKTIVSIIVSHLFLNNDFQVAILCPTEILAKQMYAQYSKYLMDGCLLTNSLTASQTKKVYEQIKNNEVRFVVGTHSLLNDNIVFDNLGLVIIDEQHRFGVNQREKLINKSTNTNVILMSATPIPRTVALVLYDNLSLTTINDLPSNRVPITTKYSSSLTLEIIEHVKKEIALGHQIYVVVPAINSNNYDSIETIYEEYLNYFDKNIISIMHGKLSNDDKENVMNKFYSSKSKILIATSVIEVGIDVKNATTIIIHSANRFGLANLHQLRGRVGRSIIASTCFVINDELSDRIELFINSSDGFEISEADYKMRGPGNLLGSEQSGYNMFKLINVFEDIKILECAKLDVEN